MGNRVGSLIVSTLAGLAIVGSASLALARCGDDPADHNKVKAVRAQMDMDCDCSTATSHGDYVNCAKTSVNTAVSNGQLPNSCRNTVVNAARKSTCGRPGAVTCCRTNQTHRTSCSVSSAADRCRAPSGGQACVGLLASCADSCVAGGCVTFTPTPAPTPTPPAFCQPVVPAPGGLVEVPMTLLAGSTDCGGAALTPPAAPPFAGEVDDAGGAKLADLGLGCLYTGNLAALRLPSGGTLKLAVSGVGLPTVTLAGGAGSGPTDCTQGALETKHCVNDNSGTDGTGTCVGDSDCGNVSGSCAMDARCFFGPPIPVTNPIPLCVVSAFQSDLCGSLDLTTNSASFATALSSRLYTQTSAAAPCPMCDGGVCVGGLNDGATCVANPTTGTSASCLPAGTNFLATLPVVIPLLTTGTSALADPSGLLCPGQATAGAFGVANAASVSESGTPMSPGLTLNVTLGASFCVSPTGFSLLDRLAGLPGPGALSAKGSVDLTSLIGLGL